MAKQMLQGEELGEYARRLGVDVTGEPRTQSSSGFATRAPDHVVQQRVAEAERGIRESRMWLLAVISAIASVISAITAIVAVLHSGH